MTGREAALFEYIHDPMEEAVVAIGGNYRLIEEKRISFDGKEILYLVAFARMDTSCCGNSGCGYAIVKGFIANWKSRKNRQGYAVSKIVPVEAAVERERIRKLITGVESVQQVVFNCEFHASVPNGCFIGG